MGLQVFWFVVIAFFWVGFFILEGFDMGVGVLQMVVGRTDLERRVAINTIGPFWTVTRFGSSSPAPPRSLRSLLGTPACSRPCTWR